MCVRKCLEEKEEYSEEDKKKGEVFALLALSGIKFTPCVEREQCMCQREWRGQNQGERERESEQQKNYSYKENFHNNN